MENEFYNEKERFISLLSDYGFKATFGNESDTRFLKKALQALINSPVPIREVKFVKNDISALTKDSRSGIYDLACTDENGNHFIVEMQLGAYAEFIQRMKFYALYRFNTLVEKGNFTFEDLPRIYCIGILAKSILPSIKDYHNIAVLRNEKGELIDEQLTFITLELDKFNTQIADIQTDLDKLIYTMKNLHKATSPTQYPQFWNEEWLKIAIDELDKKALTQEERLVYAMTISANALAVKNENKKIENAKQAKTFEVVKKMLLRGKATIEEIAEDCDVTVDFVLNIQNQLSDK